MQASVIAVSSRSRLPRLARWLAAATLRGAAFAHPAAVLGQVIHGRIVDSVTGKPIPSVTILLLTATNVPFDTIRFSDTAGVYRLQLPPRRDEYRVRVSKSGYASRTSNTVFVGVHDDVPLDIKMLAGPNTLPAMQTLGVSDGLPNGFAARRAARFGKFWTRSEIQDGHYSSLQQLFIQIPGARTTCPEGRCFLVFTGGMATGGQDCAPAYFLNGAKLRRGQDPTGTPEQIIASIPIDRVIAVEVYANNIDVPSVYATTDGGCGVIAVWTAT